ncbi:acyl-CoA thioesterase/bile acid-CoA:amino acid N-acyltransferase family protein [Shouchella shacheensis]|uniref:acyl-CoA thioesterase/bile acid-CoA:amino acid N-acyltransferase family protein n=1 Tax=Shouchella shacheensis TaxID=1649580 RepID=UPI00074006B9|nr:acyl-CoA thioester hydrolase/BAAT C-terminal domain-containing protein [Shouchella shacheensis]
MSVPLLSKPLLTISPEMALVDETLCIQVTGCSPYQSILIRARATDEENKPFVSRAYFTANDQGNVNLSKQKPDRGSYDEVDPMGLFWSMELDHPTKKGYFVKTTSAPLDLFFSVEVDQEVVAETKVSRSFMDAETSKKTVREHGLVGTLYHPSASGPYPGVLLLGGSDGGNQEHGAALLATKGYAVFALSYFGEEGVPKDLAHIPLEYFGTAIEWLQTQPFVSDEKIGAIGLSRGGELALLLGTVYPQLRAIIAGSPSAVVTPGMRNHMYAPVQAWMYQDAPITYLPFKYRLTNMFTMIRHLWKREPVSFLSLWLHSLGRADNVEAARIPVEKIQAPVMIIAGEEDQIWTSAHFSQMVRERLKQENRSYNDVYLTYKDAGHFLCFPYSLPNMPANITESVGKRMVLDYGGDAKSNTHAALDSWPQILAFFQSTFEDQSQAAKSS